MPHDLFERVDNIESQYVYPGVHVHAHRLTTAERFYTAGHDDGFAHGQLHGRFEGRALGQEKCFELWEEVGYYQGWAEFWLEHGAGKPR
jgi:hypothetical protein